MPNLTNVHVTGGVPDSGTGTVSTIDALMADGGQASIGAIADAAVTAGATGSLSAKLRAISRDLIANIVLAAGGNIIGKVGIDQTTPGTTNGVQVNAALPAGANLIGKISTDITTPGTTNRVSAQPRLFAVTASAYTRPANTTAYSANDAVSNNGTAGSVTAVTFTLSLNNDDPITLDRLRLASTDTGVQGKNMRSYFFNSDPTANTGVGGGDNAAWSQKQAGFIGSMVGSMVAFSDGAVGTLTAEAGARIITTPVSGAKTIYMLLQTIDAWTPSANSTTFTGTLEGVQGHA